MLHKVANKNEIKDGGMKKVIILGSEILLANLAGDFFAMNDSCTHKQCSLSTGSIDGNVVYCPCHGSQFDVTSGEVLVPPATIPEKIYKVKMIGDDIYIEI